MFPWRGILTHTIFIFTQPVYLAVRYLLNPQYFDSISKSWLAIIVVSWIYIVTKISIPFVMSPLHSLPSPRTDVFPIGHFDINGGKPPTENIVKLINKTPNDGMIVLWIFYMSAVIIPTRVDMLMDVLHAYNYDWEKPSATKKLLKSTLGEGLLNTEGNEHKVMRKAVAPAFSGHHVRELVPLFYAKGLAFGDAMARELEDSADRSLEIMSHMSRVTLDIIGAAGIGKDLNTIENEDEPLARLYSAIIDPNRKHMAIFMLTTIFVPLLIRRYLKGTENARVVEAQDQLRKDVRALIQEKRIQMMEEKSERQKDIIALLMKSGDISDDYLVDQLLTFLAAGHDTTASALAWTTWELSVSPKLQERLRDECKAHLAGKSVEDIDASMFDADAMPYLNAVCNETLRLYPPAPATDRVAVRPTKVGDQYIPTGTTVFVSIWAMNRNPEIWGEDALNYNPDRWLTGPYAATGGATSANALFTFLHGPRSCIGREFARLEMKCLLAALIMRFRFELMSPDQKVEVGGFVTIKPAGMRLRLYDLQNQVSTEA